jgi:hypothetical protein
VDNVPLGTLSTDASALSKKKLLQFPLLLGFEEEDSKLFIREATSLRLAETLCRAQIHPWLFISQWYRL